MKRLFAIFVSIAPLCLQGQDVQELRLRDFNPVTIYRVPVSHITKSKYPVIDLHAHPYPKTDQGIQEWIRSMNEAGIEKTVILTYSTGPRFDSILAHYAPFGNRFEVWCGFDYTGKEKPGWSQHAVRELERCYKKGARGVGELGDKGLGELYSKPEPGYGIHIDNPEMKPLLQKCAELHMPVSIHVAEDQWMYEHPDSTNDGLMNSAKWHVDMSKEGILSHDQLVTSLENAVRDNPQTTFVACHLANCCSNLSRLAAMLDKYPNLYADMAARYGEISPIPRYVKMFLEKYSDRIVYGTDMGTSDKMYQVTFRILESSDEHFYEKGIFNYHWPLYGLSLNDQTLRKIYNENARKILMK